MKNLMILILLALGAALAAPTYYNGTGNKTVETVETDYFSLLMVDVLLQPADTAYSRPFNMIKVPGNYRDTGIGDANVLPDYLAGNMVASCYDVSDSAAVTDSVDVTIQPYISEYAGDNSDPNKTGELGGKSDVWATSGSAISLDAASDTQTLVEGSVSIGHASHYYRVRLINDNTTIKDRSRCRVYWIKKGVKR